MQSENDGWMNVTKVPLSQEQLKRKKKDTALKVQSANRMMKAYYADIKLANVTPKPKTSDDADQADDARFNNKGMLLQKLRTGKGLTRKQLADKALVVSEKMIGGFENGTSQLNEELYDKLIMILQEGVVSPPVPPC